MQQSWQPSQDTFVDLRDYLVVLKRRKRLIAAIAFVCLVAAVLFTFTQTKIYTATARVYVQPAITTSSVSSPGQPVNIQNEQQLLQSTPVARLARSAMQTSVSSARLLKQLEVTTPSGADVLEIHFSDPSPRVAAAGAESFAQAYLSYRRTQAQEHIQSSVDAIDGQIAGLGNHPDPQVLAALEGQKANWLSSTVDPGTITLDAVAPSSPTSPNLVMNALLAIVLGLFLGIVAAFVRERMDDRLRGRPDLEEILAIPVMTMIPSVPGWRDRAGTQLVTVQAPRSPAAEAYRTLRTSMLVAASERSVKTQIGRASCRERV